MLIPPVLAGLDFLWPDLTAGDVAAIVLVLFAQLMASLAVAVAVGVLAAWALSALARAALRRWRRRATPPRVERRLADRTIGAP
ncbi:MAG TPA: hypothetical protein VM324_10525 [Egibacteraceae bacterium]|nr:hypothetical protein [Egibacteraceae bacterium]